MNNRPDPTDPTHEQAYREGYAHGRSEPLHPVPETPVRSNLATGWLLGLLFAGLAGLGIALLYFAQEDEPASNTTQPEINIERTVEQTEVVPDPEVEVEIPELPQNKDPNRSPGEGAQE